MDIKEPLRKGADRDKARGYRGGTECGSDRNWEEGPESRLDIDAALSENLVRMDENLVSMGENLERMVRS